VASITEIYFSILLEARSLISTCQHDWFLVRALFLVYRQLPSVCVFIWPLLCVHMERERERDSSVMSLFIETLILLDLYLLFLHYFCGGPISKYSHTGGLGL